MNSFRFGMDLSAFRQNWYWFFIWGLILLALGLVAVGAATMTTTLTMVFLGGLIFFGGIVLVVDAFTFWWHKWKGFFFQFIIGLLYLFVGYSLFIHPIISAISLTLLLGIFYLIVGIFRMIYAVASRSPQWGWVLLSGIISFILAWLILANWPASGIFFIGLFVGIDLIFLGWAYIIASLTARTLVKKY